MWVNVFISVLLLFEWYNGTLCCLLTPLEYPVLSHSNAFFVNKAHECWFVLCIWVYNNHQTLWKLGTTKGKNYLLSEKIHPGALEYNRTTIKINRKISGLRLDLPVFKREIPKFPLNNKKSIIRPYNQWYR